MSEAEDWDVAPTEEAPEDESYGPLKYEIISYPADTTLRGYHDLWRSEQLVVPDFQRRFVWDVKKASKLIESFLLGLPVPGVFLFKSRSTSSFLIVDGQQRIMSAIQFLVQSFEEKSIFRLRGVESQWEGKRFSDLTDAEQFKLGNSVLRATIIQQLDPDDETSIYQIFERLNTGGINLNPMEIRRSVNFGPIVGYLDSLNAWPSWREILGQPKADKRFRDVELLLRVLALYRRADEYEKPMKGFLNECMKHLKDDTAVLADLEKRFKSTADHVRAELGAKPFHLRGRLNFGLLDSVMATLMRSGDISELPPKFESLVDDAEFVTAVTFNTSDATVVATRLRLAATYLK